MTGWPMMKDIFIPMDSQNLQVAEFDPQEILDRVKGLELDLQGFLIPGKGMYQVNLGSSRYNVFKRSLECACCGLKANRCFLDLDQSTSARLKSYHYHFNFYGESGDSSLNRHLVLFCKDHVIPKSKGGLDDIENYQTLCYNCNSFKGDSDLPIEQIRRLIFSAYRIYKSTLSLNRAKDLVAPHRIKINKLQKDVLNITKALTVVTDDRSIGMKERLEIAKKELKYLTEECNRIELQAQISGVCPISLDVA